MTRAGKEPAALLPPLKASTVTRPFGASEPAEGTPNPKLKPEQGVATANRDEGGEEGPEHDGGRRAPIPTKTARAARRRRLRRGAIGICTDVR